MELTKTNGRRNQIAHLEKCGRCIWDYTVAVALMSHSKEGREPIEIVIGDVTSALNNLLDFDGVPKWLIVGNPQILGAEMRLNSEGLHIWIVSDHYEVNKLKVKIYKRVKDGRRWVEYKTGITDEKGFISLGRIYENAIIDSVDKYIISIQSVWESK